jgi:hypothetical protein
MTERYENLTPNEAWEGFVGDQSPREFMAYTPERTPLEAARQYVNDPAFAYNQEQEFSPEELETIARLLARHIERNLGA